MLRLLRLVTKIISSTPAATASSTIYCNVGLSTSGNISLGMTLLAGRMRVPRPATGNTALRICIEYVLLKKHSEICSATHLRSFALLRMTGGVLLKKHSEVCSATTVTYCTG